MHNTLPAMPKRLIIMALFVMALAGLSGCGGAQAAGKPDPNQHRQTNVPDTSGTAGPLGATLHTPAGLDVILQAVEKGAARWLFHIKVANPSAKSLSVRGGDIPAVASAQAQQDVLEGQFALAISPTANHPQWVPLSAPAGSDVAAHPALPAALSLPANGHAEGWLAVDAAGVASNDGRVYYLFDPVNSQACAYPPDASTCHPEVVYHVLVWNLN